MTTLTQPTTHQPRNEPAKHSQEALKTFSSALRIFVGVGISRPPNLFPHPVTARRGRPRGHGARAQAHTGDSEWNAAMPFGGTDGGARAISKQDQVMVDNVSFGECVCH